MKTLVVLIVLLATQVASAAGMNEKWSVGFFGGINTGKQEDLNLLITRANTRVGGISTPQFGNAWELGGFIMRRLNQSPLAIQIRPSYMWQTVNGSGSGGTYNYAVAGYTIMPLLRAYILESTSTQLYIHGGIGWGTLNGTIQEASALTKFSGSNFGFQGGMGVNFCFGSKGTHCIFGEGNMRYLSIDRNTVSEVTGTFASGSNASLSQAAVGRELEVDSHDLATTLSGIIAMGGYQFNF